jgi:hypothetical protein
MGRPPDRLMVARRLLLSGLALGLGVAALLVAILLLRDVLG